MELPPALPLRVDEVRDLTPRLRAVWFTGVPDGFTYEPGQDLMFLVPLAEGVVRRRYTIRQVDDRGRLEVWFVLHGHGPAAAWAARAQPGDAVDAVGPRGKVVVEPGRDWHLFVGDDSALAALLAMAEVAPGAPIVIAEVESAEDELATDGRLSMRWLHRDGAIAGDNDLLERAVDAVELPPGDGQVYLAGEKATMKRIGAMLADRGIDKEHQSRKAYWDLSRPNAGHGEPLPDGWTGPEPFANA